MRYVKLGYGCELKKFGDALFLYDLLSSKTYKIFDKRKIEICLKIFSGVVFSERDIYSKFGDDWIGLKNDLESNNLIIYSNNQSNFRDEWDLGTKCVLSKDYMSCKPVVNTAYINISNLCSMDCSSCGRLSSFDCVTCRKENSHGFIKANHFSNLISKLENYGLKNIYFCGADPLMDIELIKKYTKDVRRNINSCIISNGVLLYDNIDFMAYIAERRISLMLQCVSDDDIYLKKIFSVMENLKNRGINFSVMIKSPRNSHVIDYLNANKIIYDYVRFVDGDCVIGDDCFSRPINLQTNTIFYNNNLCLYSKIFIEPNGDVKNCFHMEPVGNLNTDSFGDLVSKLSSNWSNPNIENKKCVACDLRKNCIACSYVRKKCENRSDFCYIRS